MVQFSGGTSAFHPYIRPQKNLGQVPIEQGYSFLFTPDALMALSQFNPVAEPILPTETLKPPTPQPPEPQQSPTSIPHEKSRRKRTTFSTEQATRLESEYLSDSYMAREKRLMLAHSLGLSENQVKTWFQNRRAKDKRDRKTDNSSHTTHSRKSSPGRKSSSDSSPTPSTTTPYLLPMVHTATSPTTIDLLLPSTPPARSIQKVEQFPVQQHLANLLLQPSMEGLSSYLQNLPPSVQSLLVSSPPPFFGAPTFQTTSATH